MSDNTRDTRTPQRDENNDVDYYKWSGDCTNGNNNGTNGANPNEQDHYQYDGSGQAITGDAPQQGSTDHVPANWHPDYSFSSENAKRWLNENKNLRNQRLDVDEEGNHKVVFGDALSTIAAQHLHDQGIKGSKAEIQQEMKRIAELNKDLHPSLLTKPDYIGTGWTLRIEQRGSRPERPETSEDNKERCLPKPPCHDEVTPPGYQNKKVIVNNVYTNEAVFNQGAGWEDRSDRCVPRRGNDRDLYAYGGDGRSDSRTNDRDLYGYSGDRNDRSNNRDLYNGTNGRDLYAFGGDGSQRYVPFNGTGNDGTSYYPGAGSALDQLWDQRDYGRRDVIVNNVYTNEAIFNQTSVGCRVMNSAPRQDGRDNYYCNGGGNGDITMYPGNDGTYYPPDYPREQRTASTAWNAYTGNSQQNGDGYFDYRAQQGRGTRYDSPSYTDPYGTRDGDDAAV